MVHERRKNVRDTEPFVWTYEAGFVPITSSERKNLSIVCIENQLGNDLFRAEPIAPQRTCWAVERLPVTTMMVDLMNQNKRKLRTCSMYL